MAAPVPDALEYLWERLHDLEPASKLGGIYAFKPGYHSTRRDNKNNWPSNYSIQDQVDKEGPDNLAAALDWTFPDAQQADYDTIIKYSKRLLDCGKDPNDERLDWVREFYGQADKDTSVEGWDFRYVRSVTSDSSHLWHIHFSFSRNALTTANMDKLLEVLIGDDMAFTSDDARKVWKTDGFMDNFPWWSDHPNQGGDEAFVTPETIMNRLGETAHLAQLVGEENKAEIAELVIKVDQILAILQAGIPIPGEVVIAPASVAAVAEAVADEQRDRLQE